jgi:type II secretory pathway pseudopilin PulG
MPQKIQKKGIVSSAVKEDVGFTILNLMTSLAIMVIVLIIAIVGFTIFVAKANKIIMQHDVLNFVKMQEIYFIEKNFYHGTTGDYIKYGPPPSGPLATPDFPFVPSNGIKIEITSGDGHQYQGPPAFKAVVSHNSSKITYEYDFSTKQTTERKK